MLMRALVPRRTIRSLLAALVLAVVLAMVLTFATPTSAFASSATAASAPSSPAAGEPAQGAPAPEPAPAEAVSAAVEPAPVEPAPVEPAPVEPAPVEPAPVEPAPVTPAPVQPAPVESAPLQPVPVEPAPVEPTPAEPAPSQPEPTDPALAPTEPEEGTSDEELVAPILEPEPAQFAALDIRVACGPNDVYALSADGAVHQVTGPNNALTATLPALVPGVAGWTGVDALAASGSTLHALRNLGAGQVELLTLPSGAAGWTVAGTYASGHNRPLVAGAINVDDGRYYFGGFDGSGASTRFRLYSVGAGGVASVGSFAVSGAIATANGDIAFDTEGNLFVISGDSNFTRFTVTAAELALGGDLATTMHGRQGSQSGTTGMAFRTDGYALMSNDKQIRAYDPITWSSVTGTNPLHLDFSDLAGCGTPITITLHKDVIERADASDQFALSVTPAGSDTRSVVTSGSAVGQQDAQVGPIAVRPGVAIAIAEAMAPTSASPLSDYRSSWSCTNGTGSTGTSATVTMPLGSMVCTFVNAPLDVAPSATTVTVTKLVQQAGDSAQLPTSGWPVSVTVSGDGIRIADAAVPTSTSADGTASWSVEYASPGVAAITVAEQQRPGFRLLGIECTVNSRMVQLAPAESVTLTGIAPGSQVACTFVNEQLPTTLTLAIEVGSGGAAASAWSLQGVAPDGALPGPSSASGASTAAVTPDQPYRLVAVGGPAEYVLQGWACTDDSDGPVELVDGAVQVPLGAQVACTATVATASLVMLKSIDTTFGDTIQPEQFLLTATPDDVGALGLLPVEAVGSETESAANTFEVRPGTTYALTESSRFAYLGLAIERYDEAGVAWIAVTDPTSIVLEPGERAVFRFVNAAPPALALPLTGGVGADSYLLAGSAVLLLGLAAAATMLHRTRATDLRQGRLR